MSWTTVTTGDVSDAELLRQLAAREPAALEQLYDRHARYAMGISLRILESREEAEEVVQDVFWQLWKSQLQYDPRRGRFTTWLFTVARNRSLDRMRKRSSRPVSVPYAAVSELPAVGDPEGQVGAGQQRRTVNDALAELPDPQRQAIELSFYQGLTHSEIASATGEPLGTVKSRITRGMARLRESLADAGVVA